MRRDKMVAELSAAKKESSFYMRKVEQAKAIDAMEDRKKRRLASTHDGEAVEGRCVHQGCPALAGL